MDSITVAQAVLQRVVAKLGEAAEEAQAMRAYIAS